MIGLKCGGSRRPLVGLPAAVLLLAAGCATYVASNLDLRSELAASDWQAALARVDKRPGGRDYLLELLQRATCCTTPAASRNRTRPSSRPRISPRRSYTRSISQAAASLIVNDLTVDYPRNPCS